MQLKMVLIIYIIQVHIISTISCLRLIDLHKYLLENFRLNSVRTIMFIPIIRELQECHNYTCFPVLRI